MVNSSFNAVEVSIIAFIAVMDKASVDNLFQKLILFPIALIFTYILVAAICILIPIGENYQHRKGNVEIFIEVGTIHTAFVLPIKNEFIDFREFIHDDNAHSKNAKFVSLSWGDRAFFLETQTWAQFKLKTALRAIFLNTPSVIHLEYFTHPPAGHGYYTISLQHKEYIKLANYIKSFFMLNAYGRPIKIKKHTYSSFDEFYESLEYFHAFRTCNIWTSNGLKITGTKTAIWSPFTWGIVHYLE